MTNRRIEDELSPETLVKIRKASGLSQIALGRRAGIRRWKISHHELGLAVLSREESDRIVEVLRKAVAENTEALQTDRS